MRRGVKLVGLAVCGVCVTAALVPWRLDGAGRRSEIAAAMQRSTGLGVQLTGPVTFKLLPMPRVRIGGVSISDGANSLAVDAPALYGDLEISALLKGQWRLSSATFSEPLITADLDRMPSAATLAAFSRDGFKLSVRSGVLRLKSQQPFADTLVTGLDATAQKGYSAGDGLALSGSAVWHGSFAQFGVRIADPRSVVEGGSSPAFAEVSSAIGALSAVGDITGGAQRQFAGRLSMSSNALPRLFAAFGLDRTWLAVQRAALSGDAIVKAGDISLSGSQLHLDDMIFEGTLGYHGDSIHSLFEGTLATSLLDVGKLGAEKLDSRAAAALYVAPFSGFKAPPNLDLRVSANVVRVGAVDVQDAAISALFRDGRLELTLDEARAFEGTVRARAIATVEADGVLAHAEFALSNVQLGPLSSALLGHERVSGAFSGKLSVDGHGRSPADLVHELSGDGQVTVEQGNFTGVSVSQALKRLTRKLPMKADLSGQITSFDTATADLRIERGVLRFLNGQVTGPGMRLSFGGKSDLPQARLEIQAVASQTDAGGSVVRDGPRLPFEMRASWGEPLTMIDHARGLSLPSLPVPSLDPAQVLP